MEFIADTCRSCMGVNTVTNSFADEVHNGTHIKLSEIYYKLTKIRIPEEEGNHVGPTRICQHCTERLINAYEFICSAERNELEWQKWSDFDGECHQNVLVEDNLKYKYNICDETEDDKDDNESLEEITDFLELNKAKISTLRPESTLTQLNENSVDNSIISELPDIVKEECSKEESVPKPSSIGIRLSKRLLSQKYKCDDCYRTFSKIDALEAHRKEVHNSMGAGNKSSKAIEVSSTDTVASIDKPKKLQCPCCPRDFVRRDCYIRHLVNAHPKSAVISAEDRALVNRKQDEKALCPHCGEKFSKSSFMVHIRRHTGDNPYKCDECQKAFPRRQDLNVHMLGHTGEKPIVCSACGKSFSRHNKLARHMRIHTGERPHRCQYCNRSFIQSNDLKIHLRRHTGEKPFKCTICGEGFISGAILRKHRSCKGHHHPTDDVGDPFINWRVSTRKNNLHTTVS